MSEMAAGDPASESTIHRYIWPVDDEEPQFFDTYEYLIYTPRFEDPRASSAKVDSIRRKGKQVSYIRKGIGKLGLFIFRKIVDSGAGSPAAISDIFGC
ncbi:hypothetical protein Tco_0036423 [Tanacetum coccineum]